jgi:hypothetical protein
METPFEKRYEGWAIAPVKSIAAYMIISVYELEHSGVKEN